MYFAIPHIAINRLSIALSIELLFNVALWWIMTQEITVGECCTKRPLSTISKLDIRYDNPWGRYYRDAKLKTNRGILIYMNVFKACVFTDTHVCMIGALWCSSVQSLQPLGLRPSCTAVWQILSCVSCIIVSFFTKQSLQFSETWRKRNSTECQIIDVVATGKPNKKIQARTEQATHEHCCWTPFSCLRSDQLERWVYAHSF